MDKIVNEQTMALAELQTLGAKRVSRRDLLGWAGQGALGLAAFTLLGRAANATPAAQRLERMLPGARVLNGNGQKVLNGGGSGAMLSGDPPLPKYMAMPFWGDSEWGAPQYYQTIQAGRRMTPKTRQNADVDGDGQDELIGRNASGIQVMGFDLKTNSGQWRFRQSGPTLADFSLKNNAGVKIGWEKAEYYKTIQTADINGDGKAEIIARSNTGIKAWYFEKLDEYASEYPTLGQWTALPDGPAWHDFGVQLTTPAWDQADRYMTIQCADIDGDGRDELIGRSSDPTWYQTGTPGIQVWKFLDNWQWVQMPGIADLSDANGWNQPQYYETIQCGDIDGDGKKELIARGPNNLFIYKYVPDTSNPSDPTKGSWELHSSPAYFTDGTGWNNSIYYSTIQCADIDGDHKDEIVARGVNGVVAVQYNPANKQWSILPMGRGTDFDDNHGWDAPQYANTLQCADINGDGKAELIIKGAYGIWAYKYTDSGWSPLLYGPEWNDDPTLSIDGAAWDQPQYYQTIQTARVITPLGTRSVVLGKAIGSMQSWMYSDTTGWDTTSLKYPQYVSDGVPGSDANEQATAYQYLMENLTIDDVYEAWDIRDRYAIMTVSGIGIWQDQLSPDKGTYLPGPGNIKPANYKAVCDQISKEIALVSSVIGYQSQMHTWYTDQFINNKVSFDKIDAILNQSTTYTPKPGTSIISIMTLGIAMLSSAVGIVGTLIGPTAPIGFAIGSSLLSAAANLPGLYPTGSGGFDLTNPTAMTYAQFSQGLKDWFSNVLLTYDVNVKAITRDYGLLMVVGADDITWDSTSMDAALVTSASNYEYTLLQAMVPYYWNAGLTYDLPKNYPDQYAQIIAIPSVYQYYQWANPQGKGRNTYPSADALKAVFETYGAPVWNLYNGGDGWPGLTWVNYDNVPTGNSAAQVKATPTLARVPGTNEIEVLMRLENIGDKPAENIRVTSVQLGSRVPNGAPGATLQLRRKQAHEQAARFAPSAAAVESTVVLRIQGTYKGGTFGGSFRVKVP